MIRFGRPTEFGHTYLAVLQQAQIQKYGLFNFIYLGRNLACAFAEEGDKPKMLANLSTAFQHKDHVLKGEQMPDPRSDDSFQKYIHDDDFIKLMKQIGYNRPPDMRRSINLTRPPFV